MIRAPLKVTVLSKSLKRKTFDPIKGIQFIFPKSFEEAVWQFKVRLLEKALKEAKFNQKKATRILGITYHQFRGLYRKYRENK